MAGAPLVATPTCLFKLWVRPPTEQRPLGLCGLKPNFSEKGFLVEIVFFSRLI